jgi:hypothetical protein
LVLGQERDGLTDAALSTADLSVSIDGTGKVESLNVSVATGVLLAEWWRQNKAKSRFCRSGGTVVPPGLNIISYSLSAGNTGIQSIGISPRFFSHSFANTK